MINTYADLIAAVQNRLARSDIPVDVYSLAAEELSSRLRLRMMEKQATVETVDTYAELPADFLHIRAAWLALDRRVPLGIHDAFGEASGDSGTGQPAMFAISGTRMYLTPAPGTTYTIGLRYVSNLADFSGEGDTNNVLAAHSALFLYAALKHAALWAQDGELAAMYSATLESDIRTIRNADKVSRYPGPLSVRGRVA